MEINPFAAPRLAKKLDIFHLFDYYTETITGRLLPNVYSKSIVVTDVADSRE